MNNEQARLRVSLVEGSFEIEGSEDFVKEQSEVYKELIEKSFGSPSAPIPAVIKNNTQDQKNTNYSNVVHVEGGSVRVLADLPGNSQKEKTVNAGLLAIMALGADAEISFDLVRNICIDHSCLNKGNFTTYLKDEKKLFLTSGAGKSQMLKLTQPGKTQALKLIGAMAAESA